MANKPVATTGPSAVQTWMWCIANGVTLTIESRPDGAEPHCYIGPNDDDRTVTGLRNTIRDLEEAAAILESLTTPPPSPPAHLDSITEALALIHDIEVGDITFTVDANYEGINGILAEVIVEKVAGPNGESLGWRWWSTTDSDGHGFSRDRSAAHDAACHHIDTHTKD